MNLYTCSVSDCSINSCHFYPLQEEGGEDCLRPNFTLGLGYSRVYLLVPEKCGHRSPGPPPRDNHRGALYYGQGSSSVPLTVQPPRPKIRGVVCVLVAQSCHSLDPTDSSPLGS